MYLNTFFEYLTYVGATSSLCRIYDETSALSCTSIFKYTSQLNFLVLGPLWKIIRGVLLVSIHVCLAILNVSPIYQKDVFQEETKIRWQLPLAGQSNWPN